MNSQLKYVYRLKVTISILWYKKMNNLEKKEKIWLKLINKLNSLSFGYAHNSGEINGVLKKKTIFNKKKSIEKKLRTS